MWVLGGTGLTEGMLGRWRRTALRDLWNLPRIRHFIYQINASAAELYLRNRSGGEILRWLTMERSQSKTRLVARCLDSGGLQQG